MRRLLLALPVLLCAAASALAQEGRLADPRLDTKVTLRLGKSPLSAVVAELGRQTGVALVASDEVADDPVIVIATDQPARVVMRHLADLLNYTWTKKGRPGSYSYRLFQDLRSRREETALREQERARALQGLQAAIRQRLDLATRPPADLLREVDAAEAAREQRPPARPDRRLPDRAIREMAGSHWRVLARVAGDLPREHWEALVGGQTLRFTTRPEDRVLPLPSSVVQELRAARPVIQPPGSRVQFSSPDSELSSRRIEQEMQDQWTRAEGYRVLVWLDLPAGAGHSRATLHIKISTLMPADFGGEQHHGVPGLTISSDEVLARDGSDQIEPPPPLDSDPALRSRRVLKFPLPKQGDEAPTVEWLNGILSAIAETYEINLVADAYRHRPYALPVSKSGQELTLYQALNALVHPIARWSRQDAFIHVRRRTWCHDRWAEIPERIIRQMCDHLRQHRRFTTEELASLAISLRDEQLENLEVVVEERGVHLGWSFYAGVERTKEFLRAYGSLYPWQRERLRRGERVAYRDMPPRARRWLQAALDVRRRDEHKPPPDAGTLPAILSATRLIQRITRNEHGFIIEYRRQDSPEAAPVIAEFRSLESPPPVGGDALQDMHFQYEFNNGAVDFFRIVLPTVGVDPAEEEGRPRPPAGDEVRPGKG